MGTDFRIAACTTNAYPVLIEHRPSQSGRKLVHYEIRLLRHAGASAAPRLHPGAARGPRSGYSLRRVGVLRRVHRRASHGQGGTHHQFDDVPRDAHSLDQADQAATGTTNLSHIHPVLIAAHAAMFDHLAEGRFILGISPGALRSDAEAWV